MTAAPTYNGSAAIECRACGTIVYLRHGHGSGPGLRQVLPPGRRRQYCSDACRKAAQRARKADPEGWQRDQAARDRRANARARRKAKDDAEFEVWHARLDLGIKRYATMTAAEFEAALRSTLSQSERDDGERLLEDDTVRKLLILALMSPSEPEALSALSKARQRARAAATRA